MGDQRASRRRFSSHRAAGLFLVAATATVVTVSASAATVPPTFGPIPDSAFTVGQPIDQNQVPDFVAVSDRAGNVAGYVRREDLLDKPGTKPGPGVGVKTVYASDLKTIVGSMVPNKGFVPNGVSPASIPDFPASAGPASAEPVMVPAP